MATSIPKLKFSSHARSISLPSSAHPLLVSADEQLQRLKSSEGTSSSPHASACQKLDGLKNLYEYLNDVLELPISRQVLSRERCGKWEEDVLDGSLRLLDTCGTVREIYSQMKESVQEIESSIRRKRGGDLADKISTYMISRKKLNKSISKCLKELRRGEKNRSLAIENKESNVMPLVNLIKEVQVVSLTVLESALCFLSASRAGSQPRGWSLVSKLVQNKRSSLEGDSSEIAAIEKIEVELQLLNNQKSNKDVDVRQMQNVLKGLESVDSGIQELAELLEIVFRLFLKTRVSLLNILNR